MKKPHHPAIRALLRQHPDGLTVEAIRQAIPAISKNTTCRNCLEDMPDTYVDRWVDPRRGQWQAVWCIVVPPENCPHPDSVDRTARTRWVSAVQGHLVGF